MKLLVATGATPFVRGVVEEHAERLVEELGSAGHQVELLRLPRGRTSDQVLDALVAASLLQADNVDRVVALSFPGHLLPHPDVVVWLQEAVGPVDGEPLASTLRTAEARALTGARRTYAGSADVAAGLLASHGVSVPVLTAGDSWQHVVEELTR